MPELTLLEEEINSEGLSSSEEIGSSETVIQQDPPGEDYSGDFLEQERNFKINEITRRMEDLENIQDPRQPETLEKVEDIKYEPGTAEIVLKDIARGVTESIPQVVGGARDAIQETLETLEDVALWLNDNVVDLQIVEPEIFTAELPDVDQPESTTGKLIRSFSQFMTGFIPTVKAIQAAAAVKNITRLGRFAQAEAAAALSSVFVFDAHEERLSNIIEDHPSLSNPITEYLQAKPEDSVAEGKLKNAIESLIIGGLAEGVFQGIRAIKANRRELKVPEFKVSNVDKLNTQFESAKNKANIIIDNISNLGDGSKKVLQNVIKDIESSQGKSVVGKTRVEQLKDDLSLAGDIDPAELSKFNSAIKDMETTSKKLSKVSSKSKAEPVVDEELNKLIGDPTSKDRIIVKNATPIKVKRFLAQKQVGGKELAFDVNWSTMNSVSDMDKTINQIAKHFKNTGVDLDKEIERLASSLNMSPEDLIAKHEGKFTAEQLVSARAVMDSANINLIRMANKVGTNPGPRELFALKKMLASYSAVQSRLRGDTKSAQIALQSVQVPKGNVSKRLNDMQAILTEGGGPRVLGRVARRIRASNDVNDIRKAVLNGKGNITDTLVELWYFELLSGPTTLLINAIGSAANTLWQIPERALAAGVSKFRRRQGVEDGEATQMLYGMVQAIPDAIRMAGKTLKSGEPSDLLGKIETRNNKSITAENYGIGGAPGSIGNYMAKVVNGFGTVIRSPGRVLATEDEFFRTIGKTMERNAFSYRTAVQEGLEGEAFARRVAELRKNPTQEMVNSELSFARSLTFTTPLGDFGQGIQRATNAYPGFKAFVPFIRTPINLLKWASKRSVLAPLSSSIRAEIRKGGVEGDLAISRIMMGSGLALTFTDQALKGNITGAGPSDPALANVWRLTHQPYSIKVNDTWYSFNRSDPFGLIMGVSATLAELSGQISDEDAADIAGAVSLAISRSVLNKTWMSTPAETLEMLNRPDQLGEIWLQKFLGTALMPSIGAQTARVIDPMWREVQSITDAVIARTPGASSSLPARQNIWGEDIWLEGGLFLGNFSPFYKFTSSDRDIDKWLWDNQVGVSMPERTQWGDVDLSPEQYHRFVELAGNGIKDPNTGLGLYDGLEALIDGELAQSASWERLTDGPDGLKAEIVKGQIQLFRNLARDAMLVEFPELNTKRNEIIIQNAIDKGADPSQLPPPNIGGF